MIGGQGEKKTLRLMAEHAEMANFTVRLRRAPPQARGPGRPLRRRRAATIDTINKTSLSPGGRRRHHGGGRGLRNDFLRARGLDWDTLDEATRALVAARLVVGRPRRGRGAGPATLIGARASTASPSTCPPTATTPRPSPHDRRQALVKARRLTPDVALDAGAGRRYPAPRRASGPSGVREPKIETDVRAGPTPSGTARHNRTTLRRVPRAERSREPGSVPVPPQQRETQSSWRQRQSSARR